MKAKSGKQMCLVLAAFCTGIFSCWLLLYEFQPDSVCSRDSLDKPTTTGRGVIGIGGVDLALDKWLGDAVGVDWSKVVSCDDLLPSLGTFKFSLEYETQLPAFLAFFRAVFHAQSQGTQLEGHSSEVPSQTALFNLLGRKPFVRTVCETGFNAGHSSLLWLSSNNRSRVFSFDLAVHKYTRPMADYLCQLYPTRMHTVFGNSQITLPKFVERARVMEPGLTCDIVLVDGGHTYEVTRDDIANFGKLATPDHTLLVLDDYPSTMFDDQSIGRAWREALAAGFIRPLFQCSVGNRGFSLGYYR